VQQVVTGEAVALDLRPAALPSRLVAAGLDLLLQLVVLLVLGGLVSAVSPGLSDAATAALGIVVLVTVLVVYPVLFETLLRGRTPGKAAMGLRVVRDDGGPVGFRHAFVRGLAGAFVERPGITLFVAAVVTSLLNRSNKRIGDLLAGTLVLQERVAVKGGEVAQMPPPLAGWAAGLDLTGLPDDLALSVRQFVARAPQLSGAAREEIGGRLVSAVGAAVSPPPPPGTPGWAVLAAVLAERRRRAQLSLGAAGAAAPPTAPVCAPPATAAPAAWPPPPTAPPGAGPGGFAPPA
jgi:uncharacterized RDD family membrane protein YckC